jgi:hypothetical protein
LRISISIACTRFSRHSRTQLRALVGGQPGGAAGVDVVLLHPPPQARLGDPQIGGNLPDRLVTPAGQLHRSAAELRRLGCRHPELLSEAILASEQVSGKPEQAPSAGSALHRADD